MIDANDPRLTAYVLGELDQAERQLIERAAASSPELQQEIESIRQSTSAIEKLLQAEQSPALTDDQKVFLRRHAESQSPIENRSVSMRFWLAVAGSLLLAGLAISTFAWNFHFLPYQQVVHYESKSSTESTQSGPSGDGNANSTRDKRRSGSVNQWDVAEGGSASDMQAVISDPAPAKQPGSTVPPSSAAPPSSTVLAPLQESIEFQPSDPYEPALREETDWSEPLDSQAQLVGEGPRLAPHFKELGNSAPGQELPIERINDAASQLIKSPSGPHDLPFAESKSEPVRSDETREVRIPNPVATDKSQSDFDLYSKASGMSSGMPGMSAGMSGDSSRARNERDGNLPARPASSRPATSATPRILVTEDEFEVPLNETGGQVGSREEERAKLEQVRRQGLVAPATRPENAPGKPFGSEASGEPDRTAPNKQEPLVAAKVRSETDLQKEIKKSSGTWSRAKATPNASRLMIGDHDELPLEGMQANVVVDGFRARVLLDLYFFNNRPQQLEGNFQLRLPDDASLYYFAFGRSSYEYRPQVDQLASKGFLTADLLRASGLAPSEILKAREGSWKDVKEARVVPRDRAAHAYSETVRRRVDPALVEWSGAGVFNARVFPLFAGQLHRIVIGYDVTLEKAADGLAYRLELPEGLRQCAVDLNVAAIPGVSAEITPSCKPFTSAGRAYYHFEQAASAIELRLATAEPILLVGKDPTSQDAFFSARVIPSIPSDESQAGSNRAIFLVDTSLSSRPDKFNVWVKLLEKLLQNNRNSIQQFAVLFFNIEAHWWKEGYRENSDQNVNELMAYCHSLSLEGATNVRQAVAEAASPSWKDKSEKDSMPSPDIFLLSDGVATWGDTNVHRISEILQHGDKGTVFAYTTGLSGTSTAMLEHLTRESGGGVFSVASESEIELAATAHRKRPWKLLDVSVPGGTDLLVAGRPQSIYPGQPLMIVGRGEPSTGLSIRVGRGEEQRVVEIPLEHRLSSDLAARAYGQVAVGQLEDLGGNLESVATAYARHFRVTGQTCSLLMLESEADYQRFQIKPEDDAFVVRSTPSAELIARKLDEFAVKLADAKSEFLKRLTRLQSTPGLQFQISTVLQVLVERLPPEKFDVQVPRLICQQRDRSRLPKEFSAKLDSDPLDYDAIIAQAGDLREKLSAADGLTLLSSLVERNPNDPVLARDVAFSALESGLSGQAYLLLDNVAHLRPYEPQSYQMLAQCLAELGNADLATLYYEILLNTTWNERYRDVNRIAAVEYYRLLGRIAAGEFECNVKEYAEARRSSLSTQYSLNRADLVVVLNWNTDRTDVDLHMLEPTGEECYYSHPRTQMGGEMTADVTEGFGPEMYVLKNARAGEYKILANYFGMDANRTQVRSKAYITIYENLGDGKSERISKRTVVLGEQKQKLELATVKID